MICDVFGLDSADAFVADYRSANYEEFTGMIKAIDDYINGKGGEKVTLSGNAYTTAKDKTATTENMNGVFAIAGAEKWTYANHYTNYALNAVFSNYNATAAATKEDVDKLEEPLVKMVQELDMLSSYTAGPSGKVERGSEYLRSLPLALVFVNVYDVFFPDFIFLMVSILPVLLLRPDITYPDAPQSLYHVREYLTDRTSFLPFSDEDTAPAVRSWTLLV